MGQHGQHRALVSLALALMGAPAWADCRQALAIGLDVSASVDAAEYALQRGGMAAALTDPEVVSLILQDPSRPVRIAVYEWSGPADQYILLPWTEIADEAALAGAAALVRDAPRAAASPSTAVGAATTFGLAMLAAASDCSTLTLDLAGDGRSNTGPLPRDASEGADAIGATINALAIGLPEGQGSTPGIAELSAWFRVEVIRGPDAFVEVALGHKDFADAMRRKLIRELGTMAVSGAEPDASRYSGSDRTSIVQAAASFRTRPQDHPVR